MGRLCSCQFSCQLDRLEEQTAAYSHIDFDLPQSPVDIHGQPQPDSPILNADLVTASVRGVTKEGRDIKLVNRVIENMVRRQFSLSIV